MMMSMERMTSIKLKGEAVCLYIKGLVTPCKRRGRTKQGVKEGKTSDTTQTKNTHSNEMV